MQEFLEMHLPQFDTHTFLRGDCNIIDHRIVDMFHPVKCNLDSADMYYNRAVEVVRAVVVVMEVVERVLKLVVMEGMVTKEQLIQQIKYLRLLFSDR